MIISDRRRHNFIADVTALEIASTLARACRTHGWNERKYDGLNIAFWEDIRDRRLRVREARQDDVIRARHLIRFAGVVKRRNITSADALIAVSCLELAVEREQQIAFYTFDWTLYTILREIDAFTSALVLRFLGSGKAGIPNQTG